MSRSLRRWLGLESALWLVQSLIAIIGVAGVQFGVYSHDAGDPNQLLHAFLLAAGAATAGPTLRALSALQAKLTALIQAEPDPLTPPIGWNDPPVPPLPPPAPPAV